MEKIFYTNATEFPNSDAFVLYLLKKYYGKASATISRNENGKPFLDAPLFFSVSHTKTYLFVAFSKENIGIDAEIVNRKTEFQTIIKKFPPLERKEILTQQDFLRHWTVRESAIKWLGGSIAKDLTKLSFYNGKLKYGNVELPVQLSFLNLANHFLCVCSERDFSKVEILSIITN
ncbi:MAG: 4'-phosphopantetheinyl transferase superfamily protein [Clostridiales bacterium]|nr:4'-phosphopantetheinyl transferase superfamily protein [Clostridiales bacterium]